MSNLAYAPEPHSPAYYDNSDLVMDEMIEEIMTYGKLRIDDAYTVDLEQLISDHLADYQARYELDRR